VAGNRHQAGNTDHRPSQLVLTPEFFCDSFRLVCLALLPLHSCALEVLLILENVRALALVAQGSELDLFKLILASSILSKAVLLILLFFSVFSWAIIFRKFVVVRKLRRDSETFIRMFRKSKRFSEISTACESLRNTPLVEVFLAGYEELEAQLLPDGKTHNPGASTGASHSPTLKTINVIQRALSRASSVELTKLERNMSWLATTASVAPFIGLFGTVLGIITAFTGLGVEGTATIRAVAPGIAEALIATAAGLFAAIPAVIAYNYFVHQVKEFGSAMDDFSLEFLNLMERTFS
jgi:biopolymer transport protein TolQ